MWKKFEKFIQSLETDDKEFLPVAIEVLEKPPSPMGRLLIWFVLLLLIVALAWAFLGNIDEVAVAQGKIIPKGYTKVIQAEDKGIVKNINVKNGQKVKSGEILLELDPTVTETDLNSVRKEIAYYRLNIERINAELTSKPFNITDKKGFDAKDLSAQLSLYQSRQAEKNSRLELLDAQIRQSSNEAQVIAADLQKNIELLKIAQEREQMVEKLHQQDAVAYFTVLGYRSSRVEIEQNMRAANANYEKATAAILATKVSRQSYLAEHTRELQEQLALYRKELMRLEETERKAAQKNRLIQIISPVAGIVHSLNIHTIGAVVTEAQAILMIVPEETEFEVEAWLENKDSGFVKMGQEVEIKVESYSFQKFGVLKGLVKEIGADSIEDPNKGRLYKIIVSLEDNKLSRAEQELKIGPGMNVTAEIKTRQKRVIDFFLEPIQKYKSEALRER